MDIQETFNAVVTFARKQKTKSQSTTGACLYRKSSYEESKESTQTCFVGAFIPDNVYSTKMESQNVTDLLYAFPFLYKVLAIDGLTKVKLIHFWSAMQNIHDITVMTLWENRFKDYATNHGLDYAPPG